MADKKQIIQAAKKSDKWITKTQKQHIKFVEKSIKSLQASILRALSQIDISHFGYYPIENDASKEPFINWTIRNQGDLYKWYPLMLLPLIPIPLPNIPFPDREYIYTNFTNWSGDNKKMFEILINIENILCEEDFDFDFMNTL